MYLPIAQTVGGQPANRRVPESAAGIRLGRDNQPVLSVTAYRQLSALISQVHQLIDSVRAEAATSEIDLRVDATRRTADGLQQMLGPGRARAFSDLGRHLYWLGRYYRQGEPVKYEPDIRDIRDRDLPGIIAAVEKWGSGLLDPQLAAAISESWDAQRHASAVRDAFICLENKLRDLGGVDSSHGLSGDRLVTSLLGPASEARIELPADGFMGPLTRGEANGAYHLVKGAFLLFRNATAHRPIGCTASEAEDIIHLVNLCVRLLPSGDGRRPAEGRTRVMPPRGACPA